MIDTVMVFAAGLGTRMGAITNELPKPLIPIHNKPILEYIFDLISTYPFKRVIINTHYLPQKIEEFVKSYTFQKHNPEVLILHEEELLETAGSINKISKIIHEEAIFTMNADAIVQAPVNPFELMAQKWDQSKMDFLLLMQDFASAVGYKGSGDFDILPGGKLIRKPEGKHALMYASISILKPSTINVEKGSLKDYYLSSDRIYGLEIDGMNWYHATSPEDIKEIEQQMMVAR